MIQVICFFPVIEAELKQQANDIVDLCRSMLRGKFIRCDYKELAELTVLYLTGDLQDGDFKFKRPGALHRARWMSKLLYSIKMVILSEEIRKQSNNKSKRVFQKGQLKKIQDFVKFSIFNYVPWWWFASSKVAEAPYNDILLINSMLSYAQINVICSSAAMKELSKHLWYLTEKLAPLILFSDIVDDDTKQEHHLGLFSRLLSAQRISCQSLSMSGCRIPFSRRQRKQWTIWL